MLLPLLLGVLLILVFLMLLYLYLLLIFIFDAILANSTFEGLPYMFLILS